MNEILNNTKIEYFSLSRPFLREPDLINRWSGEDNSKAKCTFDYVCSKDIIK